MEACIYVICGLCGPPSLIPRKNWMVYLRFLSVSLVSMTQLSDKNNIIATTRRTTSMRCSIKSIQWITKVDEDNDINQ